MGLFEKILYLKETKRLFREKIDPNGGTINDDTPFRDYVELIGSGGGGSTPGYHSGLFFDANYDKTYDASTGMFPKYFDVSGITALRIQKQIDSLPFTKVGHPVWGNGTSSPPTRIDYTYNSPMMMNFTYCTRFIYDYVVSIPADALYMKTGMVVDIARCGSISAGASPSMYVTSHLIIRNSDCSISAGAFTNNSALSIYVYAKDYDNYVSMVSGASWISRLYKIEDYPDICNFG